MEACPHAEVERAEWDADMPGRSGVWHVVKTDAPKQLEREIRTRLAKMLWESRPRIRKERLRRLKEEGLERKGPRTSKHLCTVEAFDGFSSNDTEYHVEDVDGKDGDFVLWERAEGRWERTRRREPKSKGIQTAAQDFALAMFGRALKDVAPGELLSRADIHSLRGSGR